MDDNTLSGILQDLWPRRHTLNKNEWSKLFQVISQTLNRCNDPLIKTLFYSKDEAIATFFADKVFNPSLTPVEKRPPSYSILEHPNTLTRYFKNFLLDCGTKQNTYDQYIAPSKDEELNNLANTHQQDNYANEYDIDEKNIAQSAQNFLRQTEQDAQWNWVPTYLHWCFCSGEITAQKFSNAAGLASYAYKIKQLGISLKKTDVAWKSYKKTYLGRWIDMLGIDISGENIDEIRHVFKILCREAFFYVEALGDTQ
jgi:hypothetical protein